MNKDEIIFLIVFILAMILSAQPIPANGPAPGDLEIYTLRHTYDQIDSVQYSFGHQVDEYACILYHEVGIAFLIEVRDNFVILSLFSEGGNYNAMKLAKELNLLDFLPGGSFNIISTEPFGMQVVHLY